MNVKSLIRLEVVRWLFISSLTTTKDNQSSIKDQL